MLWWRRVSHRLQQSDIYFLGRCKKQPKIGLYAKKHSAISQFSQNIYINLPSLSRAERLFLLQKSDRVYFCFPMRLNPHNVCLMTWKQERTHKKWKKNDNGPAGALLSILPLIGDSPGHDWIIISENQENMGFNRKITAFACNAITLIWRLTISPVFLFIIRHAHRTLSEKKTEGGRALSSIRINYLITALNYSGAHNAVAKRAREWM